MKQQEKERQQRITQGMASIDRAFKGFDQPFYDKQSAAYREFARPQFDRQYGEALDQLHYALTRAGIQNSSAAGKAGGDLTFQRNLGEQAMEEQAIAAANEAKAKVQQTRQLLSAQLNADANASQAAQSAAAQASILGARPNFSPIGNLFANVTAGLSNYAQGAPLFGYGYSGTSSPGSAFTSGASSNGQRVVN
jgi:hypothetical protein